MLTLIPAAVTGLRALYADPEASSAALIAGIGAGAGLSVALPPLLKRRAGEP